MTGRVPLRGAHLERLLERLPARPGVYLMKDLHDRVVYVGKAKNLRVRVRSYFRASGDERPFVARLDRVLGDIEVVVTSSERDAVLLERELIARHHPRFNVDLKDNKNFLSILLADGGPYPRLVINRRPPRGAPRGRWFGPYASAAAARAIFRLIQSVFQLRVCPDSVFANRQRPCLQHQMGRCLAPCVREVPAELYRRRVEEAVRVLRGRTGGVVAELESRMQAASRDLRFEEAARLRDRIRLVEHTLDRQQVVDPSGADRDVLALHREGACGVILLMQVRKGRWLGANRFPFQRLESPDADVLRQFISQHYGSGADLPSELLLPPAAQGAEDEARDLEVLAAWLTGLRGGRVRVRVPQRGRGKALMDLARDNARQAHQASLATASILSDRLERLARRLGLSRTPHRIECFDMSTLGGRLSVGSMAVLIEGEPAKSAYRRYRIREAAPDADVAMMREVIGRRFRPVLEGSEEGPDLVVLDGGRGQLNAVQALFDDLGVSDVDLVALAKGRARRGKTTERVFVPGRKNPVAVRPGSDELYLLAKIRDEAHRFAIGYHRTLRRKTNLRSVLEEIPGVGPVLRRRLLQRFEGLRGVRRASAEELAQVEGISTTLARTIRAFLSEIDGLTGGREPGSGSV